jgi:SAM-dependent methyltransferase
VQTLNPASSKVLVLGDRDGGISLWFAKLGFDVLCTSYRAPGAEVASLHERWGVRQRVTCAAADVYKLDYPNDAFDVVASKSVLGGLALDYKDASTRTLENQKLAVTSVRRVLKPGGIYLGAENLIGTGLHMWLRKKRTKGKLGWRYLAGSELKYMFDSYSAFEQKPHGFLGTHWPGGSAVNGLCAAADLGLSRILPGGWLYISFIRARK